MQLALASEMMAYGLVGKPVDSCFEDAEKTGKLHLSNRNLREFPKSSANYDMEDVYLIELANNKFKKIPEALKNCMILTKLNLHNNFLREISFELKNLFTLKELILSRNSLTVFPLTITTYTKLELLDISCNLLSIVPEDIMFLENLKVLDLSSNYLQNIPNTVGKLSKLKSLNLSRNKLEYVPEEIRYCSLMKLDLSFNKLSEIPSGYRHMFILQEFNLQSNPLRFPPAKICSLGKAHIFKFLSLLASHVEKDGLSQEELDMRKRFIETREKMQRRPVSSKSNFEDYDFDYYSPSVSQLSINTPTIISQDDSRITTPDIQQGYQRLDSAQGPDYNSLYKDYLRRDKNSNDDLDGFTRGSPPDTAVLRTTSSRRSEAKRRSSYYDTEQKPVLSMYATLPRNFRPPTTASTESGDGSGTETVNRLQPKVRSALRMSPYMRRPYNNTEEQDLNHSVLDSRSSFENSQEGGRLLKAKQKQFAQVSRAESTRSSSSSGGYFGAPFSYGADLRRASSNKYIDHTPDVPAPDKSRGRNNSQNKDAPKRSQSPGSDGSTVSDTLTPKASPEPPDAFSPVPVQYKRETNNMRSPPPPPPPPRTFTAATQLTLKLSSEKGQVAKLSFEKGKPNPSQDSEKFFKSKKSSVKDEEGGNLTIRRKEYNVHLMDSQIEYIVKQVKQRMGVDINNFETFIEDGVLACQLVNLVQQDLVSIYYPEKNKKLSTRQITLNIEKFLEGCQKLDVPSNYMCSAADITQGQDLSKVLKNFIYLLNSSAV